MAGTEVLQPSPDINWAKNIYDPKTGDNISSVPGITRISMGSTLYSATERGIVVTKRGVVGNVTIPDNDTRLYLGDLSSSPSIRVSANLDRPFDFKDAERINKAAELALGLSRAEISFRAFERVQRLGLEYLNLLKQIAAQADLKSLRNIAVLEDAIGSDAQRDYPGEFLRVADEMDRIGIIEILVAHPGEHASNGASFTADHIRKIYGPKEKAA